jgi:hypothetical protein
LMYWTECQTDQEAIRYDPVAIETCFQVDQLQRRYPAFRVLKTRTSIRDSNKVSVL